MAIEILDLVDRHDVVIAQQPRTFFYEQRNPHFRVVNAFVCNDQGQLWIPRRTQSKKLFPLCLDASMGGHVVAGETYDEACARELREELGIDVSSVMCEYIGSMNPYDHHTSAFMRVYRVRTNSVPAFNTEDFCEYYWLSPQELLARIAQGDGAKGDLALMVEHFFMSGV